MANTYELISSVTVGAGGASSIDFTSIPATFTDLCLVISGRTTRTGYSNAYMKLLLNSSTSGYTNKTLEGDGSAASSESNIYTDRSFIFGLNGANATTNAFGSIQIYFSNYAGSNYKSFSAEGVTETNATAVQTVMMANLWSNSSAITSISLSDNNGYNFVQYSTAYLYGIKNS